MRTQSPPLRWTLTGAGVLLLLSGLAAAYFWMYWLAPIRRLNDRNWLAKSTEAERWAEEQKSYRRTGRSPDLCFNNDRIGYYGDAEWFFWLEERIRSRHFRHCGCTQYALTLMTNQKPDSWESWTQANRNRSQEAWIRDGFAQYGVSVQIPPREEDTVPLLQLLGRPSWNVLYWGTQRPEKASPEAVPSFIHYNAFRFLRDSDFEVTKFLSHHKEAAEDPLTNKGLLVYALWLSSWPGTGEVGVLSFGREAASEFYDEPQPILNRPWASAGIHALIGLAIVGGGILIVRFGWRRPRGAPVD